MFGTTFGHGTLRKYVIFFGTLFNNIYLNRYYANGTLAQRMKVPLNYGPREKFLARLDGNPNLDRPIAIQLPRMAFELTNLYYDPTRKVNTLTKYINRTNTETGANYQYAPVPYNIEFQLSIMVKNAEDGTFIIEQILPYFTPEWTATLNINPDMGQKYDTPVVLENITHEDTYEGNFETRRALIWTLTFTMKGWLFGPTKSGGKLISEIDLNLAIPNGALNFRTANSTNTQGISNIEITPGVSGNSAVNWYGDANATIRPTVDSANSVSIDDNYGFMVDFISTEEGI